MASIHEAGHLVVAQLFGVHGRAWIAPSDGSLMRGQKTWVGQCEFPALYRTRLLGRRRIMIAACGYVAEQCWKSRADADAFPIFHWDALCDPGAISPTDWAMADCEPGKPSRELVSACEAVEQYLRAGGSLWPDLLVASRLLISAASRHKRPMEAVAISTGAE